MIKFFVFALLACASAAPRHHGAHRPYNERQGSFELDDPFGDRYFDTRRFWSELEAELRKIDDVINTFRTHFPVGSSSEGLFGNEYKIVIQLPGYEVNDIIVKAREGVLMIQATTTKSGTHKNYLDIRTLPDEIDIKGTWTYENEILTIIFPTKNAVTQAPAVNKEQSREEMGENNNENTQDADVGINKQDIEPSIQTNEVPTSRPPVEYTTYAVDLRNDVEFVPVNY